MTSRSLTRRRVRLSNRTMIKMIHEVSYSGLHKWIRKRFGRADHCESRNCPKTCFRFEWALKKGRRYSRDIKDYKQLCSSCHKRYDYTDERKNKMRASMKGRKITWNTKVSETNKNRIWTKEMREKISNENKFRPHTSKRNKYGQFTK